MRSNKPVIATLFCDLQIRSTFLCRLFFKTILILSHLRLDIISRIWHFRGVVNMYMSHLTTRITLDPDSFAWLQANQHSTLFQFTLIRGPRTLVQSATVKGVSTSTAFDKYAGNVFLRHVHISYLTIMLIPHRNV
jgi:hypothetical protein